MRARWAQKRSCCFPATDINGAPLQQFYHPRCPHPRNNRNRRSCPITTSTSDETELKSN